jgi:hypothetical protein
MRRVDAQPGFDTPAINPLVTPMVLGGASVVFVKAPAPLKNPYELDLRLRICEA